MLLQRLLDALTTQVTNGAFTYSVVVADNDAARSAQPLVEAFAARAPWPVAYASEPRKNIALVRNKALEHATGDFIAFIDDDEFPVPEWLAELLRTIKATRAAAVLGPVRPHFDTPPPAWLIKGRFCERPEDPTGTRLQWANCRTGNVLFRRSIIAGVAHPFHEQFGSGGEDQDFFRRMAEAGHEFVWCNEAVAYETVPPSRWTRSFLLSRALLRGRNSLKHPKGRTKLIAVSLAAVPLYSALLPFTVLVGHHVTMKYTVKFCDHFGRLLTLLHLNPVHERQM